MYTGRDHTVLLLHAIISCLHAYIYTCFPDFGTAIPTSFNIENVLFHYIYIITCDFVKLMLVIGYKLHLLSTAELEQVTCTCYRQTIMHITKTLDEHTLKQFTYSQGLVA